ncbi:hypothetical protein JX266_014385 [Neoarthrinium moseri]|nr:hypothetical protein JX266_014385 [Neoarthrinium moseri]
MVFSGDYVKQIYQLANELWVVNGTMPDGLNNWSYWYYDPTIDSEKPVIAMYIIEEGVNVVNATHTKPFLDLGPLIHQSKNGTYLDLGQWTGISLQDGPCQETGNANPRFPIYMKQYNPDAQAQVYELFRNATTSDSSPFSDALFMFEGYSQNGVKAQGNDVSAFAYRSENILAAPLLTYVPTGPAVEQAAYKLGSKMRTILDQGANEGNLKAYVNYAYGDETATSWYGSQPWRQDRLRTLKQKYDPMGKFSFYGPID